MGEFVGGRVSQENNHSAGGAGHIWNRIVLFLEKASAQRHVIALRDGMIGSIPVILVGSTFLLLGAMGDPLKEYCPNFAASPVGQWYLGMVPTILLPYRYTMGMLSIYVSFTIAAALAKQYELPPVPAGLTAMATFLVGGDLVNGAIYQKGQPFDPATAKAANWVSTGPLGADGLFLAIIVGIVTVEISRFLTYKPKESEDDALANVPPAVVQAFASFLPMLTCVFLMFIIRHILGVSPYEFIVEHTGGLKELGDSFQAVIMVNLLLHIVGVAGVHGISVINAVMLPIWLGFLAHNADAHAAGEALPYVTAMPFYQFFVWLGGAGATFPATIRCLMSKNAHVKKIGQVAIVPAFFNVNEPLLFGLPVVANPILAVPFILAPLASGTIAYFAMHWDLVGRTWIEVPWVMPCFAGALLSTQDTAALALIAVNLVVTYAIWAPFITGYEHRLAQDAKAEGESSASEPN